MKGTEGIATVVVLGMAAAVAAAAAAAATVEAEVPFVGVGSADSHSMAGSTVPVVSVWVQCQVLSVVLMRLPVALPGLA